MIAKIVPTSFTGLVSLREGITNDRIKSVLLRANPFWLVKAGLLKVLFAFHPNKPACLRCRPALKDGVAGLKAANEDILGGGGGEEIIKVE